MTRKHLMLIGLVVLLGGFSLYLNSDLFAKKDIQIFHRSLQDRSWFRRRAAAPDAAIKPIAFGFTKPLKLTLLKVVSVSDLETNKFPHAFWHMISDSNSVPTTTFNYGMYIRGMRPYLKGAQPEPLVPGVNYRLFIEAGAFKATHDFVPDRKTQ